MYNNKRLLLIILGVILLLVGCSKEKSTFNQINPLNKDDIHVISLTVGNSSPTREVMNPSLITSILDNLNKITFSKMSVKEEKTVLDNGNKYSLTSTYVLEFIKEKNDKVQLNIILISDKELLLADVKTMQSNSRTVLYINETDESSLEAVNSIYSEIKQLVTEYAQTEQFMKKAGEKGLTESMLRTLGNLGYTREEILNLPAEVIAQIFAPGTPLEGAGQFQPTDIQIKELNKRGIDTHMSLILGNLGYKYEDMLNLTPEEVDFIFPNTELMANLEQKGFTKQQVHSLVDQGKSFKEIIRNALNQ
ncbi:hypothetical protein [Paradesulfitobacterium ferrireducens]|uniref:hypothetical protein n=1 Tax=Paradesulfitobacterium ferrireducens TaxID=2816476 RepID=UPI001A8DD2E5|nr:hypothetical protein [Paradesulfitobacterium ferrireducens]